MDKKNILLMISKFPPEYSGPGVRIPRLYKWFKEKDYNFNVNVLCNGVEKIKNEEYDFEGLLVRRITAAFLNKIFVKLKFLPKRLTHAIVYQYEFIKTLLILFSSKKYKNTDFLHVAGHSGGTAAALLWAKLRDIPTLLELVNSSARPYQKFLFFFKVSVAEEGKIAFLTEHSAKFYQDKGIRQKNIWIKFNPVDIEKFKIEENKKPFLRNKLTPFDKDDFVILSVAKFMPRKNQFFLLPVLKLLPKNYKLILAGPTIDQGSNFERDEKYFQDILSLIKVNYLGERVHVISDYVESDQYMKASDIYVMPAWGEGLGTPMLEAMACGLPVVANEAEPSFQEWIRSDNNGFLADINNPEEWAESLIKSSKFDTVKRQKISEGIRDKVSQEKIFSKYEQVFKCFLKI